MSSHPLCEVFGYPIDDFSAEAVRHREEKLCPYNNSSRFCTKDKKNDPLGVCSMWHEGKPVIICPVRFRQNWRVVSDMSSFLLHNPSGKFVTEATIKDADKESAGHIDVVLLETGPDQRITDFGALEIQAVYITGNIRNPFAFYYEAPAMRFAESWNGANDPHPDWLSSVKRLVRQLTVKGAIIRAWDKKIAVAVESQFYNTLTLLENIREYPPEEADMGWFLYSLVSNPQSGRFELELERKVYIKFADAQEKLSRINPGDITDFTFTLENKYQKKYHPKAKRSR